MSLTTGLQVGVLISNRVDSVPQSMAARLPIALRPWPICRRTFGQLLGHPTPDGVVTPHQVPGVVRVEAFDPSRVPPTPPPGRGPYQAIGTAASLSAAYW